MKHKVTITKASASSQGHHSYDTLQEFTGPRGEELAIEAKDAARKMARADNPDGQNHDFAWRRISDLDYPAEDGSSTVVYHLFYQGKWTGYAVRWFLRREAGDLASEINLHNDVLSEEPYEWRKGIEGYAMGLGREPSEESTKFKRVRVSTHTEGSCARCDSVHSPEEALRLNMAGLFPGEPVK